MYLWSWCKLVRGARNGWWISWRTFNMFVLFSLGKYYRGWFSIAVTGILCFQLGWVSPLFLLQIQFQKGVMFNTKWMVTEVDFATPGPETCWSRRRYHRHHRACWCRRDGLSGCKKGWQGQMFFSLVAIGSMYGISIYTFSWFLL